jgi:hypothetical protein
VTSITKGQFVIANVKPGSVAIVGDGAVGLLGVFSAKQMEAEPDEPWKGVRPHAAAGRSGGRLSRDGRATRDQDAASSLRGREEFWSEITLCCKLLQHRGKFRGWVFGRFAQPVCRADGVTRGRV